MRENKKGSQVRGNQEGESQIRMKDTEEKDQDQAVKMESEKEGEINHYKINSVKNINDRASDELFLADRSTLSFKL